MRFVLSAISYKTIGSSLKYLTQASTTIFHGYIYVSRQYFTAGIKGGLHSVTSLLEVFRYVANSQH